jgi:hypothetical protein
VDFTSGEVMAVPSKWRQHIESWQSSGLSQVEYCAQQRINVGTFTARLSEYRKLLASKAAALIPVQVAPDQSVESTAIVFTHDQGHRLLLPSSVSAHWVAELLRCLD